MFSGARPPVPQPSSFQQPVLMGPLGSQTMQVCVCMLYTCMDVSVLVSGCGCCLVPSPHFHFEVRMEIVTGNKCSVLWVWICASVHGCGDVIEEQLRKSD